MTARRSDRARWRESTPIPATSLPPLAPRRPAMRWTWTDTVFATGLSVLFLCGVALLIAGAL